MDYPTDVYGPNGKLWWELDKLHLPRVVRPLA